MTNSNVAPTRFDLQKLFSLAYEKAMTSTNIRSEFSKTGVYPFNPSSLTDEALTASKLKDKPTLGSQQTQGDLPEERVCSAVCFITTK